MTAVDTGAWIRSNRLGTRMLAIRPEQLSVFEDAVRPTLVAEATQRLAVRHGRYFAALGPAVVRAVVEHGMRRAEQLGAGTEWGIDAVTELVLILGAGFDRDPLLPWVGEFFASAPSGPAAGELPLLSGLVSRYVEETAGPHGVAMRLALQRLASFEWGAWSVPPMQRRGDASGPVLAALYPEKVSALDRRGLLGTLLRAGEATATRHGLTDDRGSLLCVVLTLVLGAHFDDDPQFPWARGFTTTAALLDDAYGFLQRVVAAVEA